MPGSEPAAFSVEKLISMMDGRDSEFKITVPGFQRGIVWGHSHRKELVESILNGYPIGSILLWKRGVDDEVIQYSLIDGLQRCTSLQKYNREPTQHLDTAWLKTKDWYQALKRNIYQEGIEGFDDIIISWIRSLGNLQSATSTSFQTMLRDSGSLTDAQILNLNESIQQFVTGLQRDYSILAYKVPAVIYDGPSEHLTEIFTRINRNGKPLTKLQIIAAAWSNCKVKLDEDNQIERLISTKAKLRLQSFEEDGYEVEDFDEHDTKSFCGDLFQYCFGLGKVLLEKGKNIFPQSNMTDPDTIAFYLLGISHKSRIGNLSNLPKKIGGNPYSAPNLSGFSAAAIDAVETVSRWFRWLTDLNLNRTGDEPFIPHSVNQMISIVCRVMLAKYTTSDWQIRSSWREQENDMRSSIRTWYLLDILGNEWAGSGDSLLFNRCWAEEENDEGETTLVPARSYISNPDRESCEAELESWYQNHMQWKQSSRPQLHSKHKLVLKYIYSRLMSVADNANQRFHIEHINSVSHMVEKISTDGSGGWPMNSIANMMLLEHSLNTVKGNATIKEYITENELDEEIEQQILRCLISDLDDIPSPDDLNEVTYRSYCNNRWRVVKPYILHVLGHPQPLRTDAIAPPPLQLSAFSEVSGELAAELPQISRSRPPETTYVSIRNQIIDTQDNRGSGTPKTSSEITLQCSEIVGASLDSTLKRESRAKFTSTCGQHAICTLVSKEHKSQGKYWFGIFDHQLEWFESLDVENQWFALACGGPGLIFRIPVNTIRELQGSLSSRYLEPPRDNTYWHINIKNVDGRWEILTIKGNDNFILDDYQIVE